MFAAIAGPEPSGLRVTSAPGCAARVLCPDPSPRKARLITVRSLDVGDHGTLRVGDRHQYVTDALTGEPLITYQVWVQEPVERIAPTAEVSIDG